MRRLLISVVALRSRSLLPRPSIITGAMFLHPQSVSGRPSLPSPRASALSRTAFEFRPLDQPRELPDLHFVDGDGAPFRSPISAVASFS